MFCSNYHRNQMGFTLIELLVTIAIIGIIAAVAAPNMQRQIRQAKIKDGVNVLEMALRDARTQALINQRATKVTLNGNTVTVDYVGEDTSASTYKPIIYSLDNNLTITSTPSTLTAVSFSTNKQAYQGDTTSGTKMGQNSSGANLDTKFSVCFGAGLYKYSVSVDANSNITSKSDGVCS